MQEADYAEVEGPSSSDACGAASVLQSVEKSSSTRMPETLTFRLS
jgi:hypothetical protein